MTLKLIPLMMCFFIALVVANSDVGIWMQLSVAMMLFLLYLRAEG